MALCYDVKTQLFDFDLTLRCKEREGERAEHSRREQDFGTKQQQQMLIAFTYL